MTVEEMRKHAAHLRIVFRDHDYEPQRFKQPVETYMMLVEIGAEICARLDKLIEKGERDG